MNQPLRLLAVFPHPDDESLGRSPTLAKNAAVGVEIFALVNGGRKVKTDLFEGIR